MPFDFRKTNEIALTIVLAGLGSSFFVPIAIADEFEVKTDRANFRWHAAAENADEATIKLKVSGLIEEEIELGSGELREQLGLMLRYKNECNLVYVMWRFKEKRVFVQEKSNPGQEVHAECLNHGYSTIEPREWRGIPAAASGSIHRMHARITEDNLSVSVDGIEVWRGEAPLYIKSGIDVGFRSDNVMAAFSLLPNHKI